jgi:hypothetical protein
MRNKLSVGVGALALLLAGLGLSAPVRASEDECRVPMAEWRPREQLEAKIRAEGWQRLDRIEVDDGCYEAKGYDREGWRVEAKYDPKTFELVKLERKRERIRERVRDPAAAAPNAGSPGGPPAAGPGPGDQGGSGGRGN